MSTEVGNKIKVVGFDPSFRNFGVAYADVDIETLDVDVTSIDIIQTESRAGKTVRKNSDDLRCARELITAIRKATKDCVLCVAEVPVGTQSARAAWSLGIALCTLGTIDKPLIEVTPSEVKLSTVGKKTASKTEMIGWAMDQHPRLDWKVRKVKGVFKPVAANEHMADAIAAIYAGVYSEQFKQFVAAFNSIRNSNE